MMTWEEFVRQARARGLPMDAELRREWEVQTGYEFAQHQRAAAAKAEAEHPRPAFTFDRSDEIERRMTAQLDRDMDPQRAAMKAAKRAQIEAQVATLREQRDALNRRLAQLDEEWRDNL